MISPTSAGRSKSLPSGADERSKPAVAQPPKEELEKTLGLLADLRSSRSAFARFGGSAGDPLKRTEALRAYDPSLEVARRLAAIAPALKPLVARFLDKAGLPNDLQGLVRGAVLGSSGSAPLAVRPLERTQAVSGPIGNATLSTDQVKRGLGEDPELGSASDASIRAALPELAHARIERFSRDPGAGTAALRLLARAVELDPSLTFKRDDIWRAAAPLAHEPAAMLALARILRARPAIALFDKSLEKAGLYEEVPRFTIPQALPSRRRELRVLPEGPIGDFSTFGFSEYERGDKPLPLLSDREIDSRKSDLLNGPQGWLNRQRTQIGKANYLLALARMHELGLTSFRGTPKAALEDLYGNGVPSYFEDEPALLTAALSISRALYGRVDKLVIQDLGPVASHPNAFTDGDVSAEEVAQVLSTGLAALDPAAKVSVEERSSGLAGLLGGEVRLDFAELAPALLKAREDGKLRRLKLGELTEKDAKVLAKELGTFGNPLAAAVIAGLTLRGSASAFKDLLGEPHAASVAAGIAGLEGEALTQVMAPVASEYPNLVDVATRLALLGSADPARTIAAQLVGADARAQADILYAFADLASELPAATVVGILEALVKADIAPEALAVLGSARLSNAIDTLVGQAVTAYQTSADADALAHTLAFASSIADLGSLPAVVLGDLHTWAMKSRVSLEDAAATLQPVEERAVERVKIGSSAIPKCVNPARDLDAVPRKAIADLVMTATTEANLDLLGIALETRTPVLLEGPTSAGKTALIRYLAYITETPFRRINMSKYTDTSDLIGRMVGGERQFTRADLDAKTDDQLAVLVREYGLEGESKRSAIIDGIVSAQTKPRWVDGVLLKAMRRGEFVVLDELNLAGSDVLERIKSLFTGGKIVVTENDSEVITPHDDFRIFATQNPASFSGRARLSEAVASCWTQVNLSGFTKNDLMTIMDARYGRDLSPEAMESLVGTHMALTRLTDTGSLGRSAGGIAFTLRNLFAVAERVRTFEGNGMAPEALLRREVDEVYCGRLLDKADRESADAVLAVTLPYNGPGFYDDLILKRESDGNWWIGDVCVQPLGIVHPETPDASAELAMTPDALQVWYRLAKSLQMNERPFIAGPSQSGKQSYVTALAYARQQPYMPMWAGPYTDTSELMGHPTLNGWQDGRFLQAVREGGSPGIFALHNTERCNPAVIERLNSALDDDRAIVLTEHTGKLIRLHEQSRVVFTATYDPEDVSTMGLRNLSPAFLNRVTIIPAPRVAGKTAVAVGAHHAVQRGLDPAVGEVLVELAQWVNDEMKAGRIGKTLDREERRPVRVRQSVQMIRAVAALEKARGIDDAYERTVRLAFAKLPPDEQTAIIERARLIASGDGAK